MVKGSSNPVWEDPCATALMFLSNVVPPAVGSVVENF